MKVFYVLIGLILALTPAFAQNGSIRGVLLDQQGSAIPGIKIRATDEAKGIVIRESSSQADGSFDLSPLNAGIYKVSAELKGFKTMERRGLVLDIQQAVNLGKVVMEVGAVTDSVTIDASVPLVETSTAQHSYVVTDKQVNELSLNGRDFQNLMKTLPGVVSNDQSDFRLAFNSTNNWNTNGLRGSMNNASLDGSINTDVGANDGQYTQVSLDAVGEFKLQTSTFNAEYGRSAGVMISATTKAGTKQFHGTAYDFGRNDALDANAYFRNLQNQSKAKLRYNQFGGNLGGPGYIPHVSSRANTKLFFFFNFEGTRATRPNGAAFVDAYRPELLQGDFSKLYRFNANGSPATISGTTFNTGTVFQPGSIVRNAAGNITGGIPYPGNIVPKSAWSKNAVGFLNVLNRLDRNGAPDTPNVPESVRVPLNDSYLFNKNAKVARIDYTLSQKNNIFLRWADDAQQESTGLGIFNSTSFPVFPEYRKKPGSSWGVNMVNVISPSMTNEFVFTYNHLTQIVDVVPGTDPASYDRGKLGFTYQELYTGVNKDNKFPSMSGCGTPCSFTSFAAGWTSEGKTFAFSDSITYRRGKHAFKTGAFINRNVNGQQPTWTDTVNFNFGTGVNNPNDTNNGLANMLLGNYLSAAQTNGIYYGSFAFLGTEFFAQDTWRIGRSLMLEYGARYVYQGPTYSYGKYLASYFDPALYDKAKAVQIDIANGPQKGRILPGIGDPFNGMVQEGSASIPSGFAKHRKNQVSPRLGFAWDVFGNGKTAIRGGGGTFYERIQQNVFNFGGLGNPPLNYTPTVYGGNVDTLSPSLVSGGTRFPVSVVAFNQEAKTPTIYSWSFTLEQQLFSKTSMQLTYVGNMARHMQYGRNINQLPLGSTTAPGNTILSAAGNLNNAVVPYKGYSNLNYTDFGANSNYNALQSRFSRRYTTGFTMNVGYTWSKAMDMVDSDTTIIADFQNRNREYGIAGFDRTHVLSIDYVYEIGKLTNKMGLKNKFAKSVLNGWEVSGIYKYQSGFPLTITSSGNPGMVFNGTVRANYLGGDVIPAVQDRLNYYDPLVFGRPLDGSLGNTGKGILRGPHINQWDASLFRNVQINERMRLQFRFETFNSLNHTQWYGVNTGVSASNPGDRVTANTRGSAGQITSTRDPRNVQLSMKFYF